MDASAAKRGEPVPDICPLDRYDPTRAKTRAGVRWLLDRSRGPEEGKPPQHQHHTQHPRAAAETVCVLEMSACTGAQGVTAAVCEIQ